MFSRILQHKLFPQVAVGVAALGSGAFVGYFIGKDQLTRVVRKEIDSRLGTMITTIEENTIKIETATTVDLNQLSLLDNALVDLNEEVPLNVTSIFKREEVVMEPQATVNIFENEIAGWDYERELALRGPDKPYVIHRDEFYGDEMGWDDQQSLMWYEVDKILATEDDSVVYNPDAMIGDGVRYFGHGSGDPNVVFIRNEKLHVEYEVTRNPGSYEHDVLGEMVEREMEARDLKHSRAPGKMYRE